MMLLLLGGAFAVALLPSRVAKYAAAGFSAAVLLIALRIAYEFDSTGGLQFVVDVSWISSIGARYLVGVDGMGLAFVLLTASVSLLAICSSWAPIRHCEKEYYAWFLLLEAATIGVFVSLDLLLFFMFFEAVLIPMYFLIAIWGGEQRSFAATKFLIYTLAGTVLLMIGIFALQQYHFDATGIRTFDLRKLSLRNGEPWIFWLFFIGFAVKVPMVPIHTWLPDAHTEAPTAGSVMLASLLLKLGTYGMARFLLPLFPSASRDPRNVKIIAALAIAGILYGGLVCLMQTDWKRLIAYSSVSHMGFVVLALFAGTQAAITGSLLQQINHGIATGLLFLIVGVAYERRHTRAISAFGGLSKPMPRFAAVFLIAILSSMGMPPLSGFVGDVAILQGLLPVSSAWAGCAIAGILLGAAYLLWLYQRTMLGAPREENVLLPDLTRLEILTMSPFAIATVWIGLQPSGLLALLAPPEERIIGR